jgi:adenosylcobinamide kinase/adenosylcobinamide-phosphate guanylyltransferase
LSKLVLVTGGARSGKSTFAEEMAKKVGNNILYVATSIPFDDEMKLRIKKHREHRPSSWETVEAYKDMDIHLEDKIKGKDGVILDCLTIMITNIMLERYEDWDNISAEEADEVEKHVKSEIDKLLGVIKKCTIPFIAVTNETGMGVVPWNKVGRAFRDIAGRTNQIMARAAQEVYLCISGIPVRIK